MTIAITRGDGSRGNKDGWTIAAISNGIVIASTWTAGGKRDANEEAEAMLTRLSAERGGAEALVRRRANEAP